MTNDEIMANYLGNVQAIKRFEDGEIAIITKMLFTYAILYELNPYGYGDRWCYRTAEAALAALTEWDGTGDPQGWHRHPDSGRRVDEDGKTYVNF